MRYRTLGNTGLLVSEICLGTMTFGGRGLWTAIGALDQSLADRIVGRVRAQCSPYADLDPPHTAQSCVQPRAVRRAVRGYRSHP